MRLRKIVTPIAVLLPASGRVVACTLCHTDLAREVRASVFGDDFWQNTGILVLPILLVAAIALFIQDGGKRK